MAFTPINTITPINILPEAVMSDNDAPTTSRNGGNGWTEAETRELYRFRLAEKFLGHDEIGARLGRSSQACRLRLMKLRRGELGPRYADLDKTKALERPPTSTTKKTTTAPKSRARKVPGPAAQKIHKPSGTAARKSPTPAAPEVRNFRGNVPQSPLKLPSIKELDASILTDAAYEREQERIALALANQASSSVTPVSLTGLDPRTPMPQLEPSFPEFIKLLRGLRHRPLPSRVPDILDQAYEDWKRRNLANPAATTQPETTVSWSSSTPIDLTGIDLADPEILLWLYEHSFNKTAAQLIRQAEESRMSPEIRAQLARFRAYNHVEQLITPAENDRERRI